MLNFGIVGSGWITDTYINGAKDSGLWNLTAVYSRTQARGEEYAKKHDANHVFTSLDDMAKSDLIDAVYIASPNSLHVEQSRLFLENGKHVICEKPISAQADNVRELNSLAVKNGLVFIEAIMFMHLPQRKIIEAGISKIGNISMCKMDYCQRSSKLDRYLKGELPNIFNPRFETGALMDLGIYCVYPTIHWFGVPDKIQACGLMIESGADINGIINLIYSDKLVTLTYSKNGESAAKTEIQGNDGTVYIDSLAQLADSKIIFTNGHHERLTGSEEKYKLMGDEAKDFYRYIMDPENSAEEYATCRRLAVEVSDFMEKARREIGIKFDSDSKIP